MLEIQNLCKKFGKKNVLVNFTYTFSDGVYGLLGPNGAGKTTLIRCLTRLYDIKKDTIFYNHECIRKNRNYLSTVGYLPQKFGLFKDLKVIEAMQLLASLKDIEHKKAKRMAEECIELVNLSDRLNDRVGTLSGGMVRRLGIAQAMLGNPKIIILDEPTAGLDPEERLRFKTIISQIKKDKTILISTHIVEDVEASCDTVIVMKDGSVGASGSCPQIKNIAEGKAYLVPEKDKVFIEGKYVVQRQIERDGQTMLKILTNSSQSFEAISPEVEDGYVCVLKNI